MNEVGARALVAAILKANYDDCRKRKSPMAARYGSRVFLKSRWCRTLCDGVDIGYAKYREVCEKELDGGGALVD